MKPIKLKLLSYNEDSTKYKFILPSGKEVECFCEVPAADRTLKSALKDEDLTRNFLCVSRSFNDNGVFKIFITECIPFYSAIKTDVVPKESKQTTLNEVINK